MAHELNMASADIPQLSPADLQAIHEHLESAEDNPKSKKKVNRPSTLASVACMFCKKRKIGCSGERPCTQCTKRGIDCIYPASQSKRGPKPKGPAPPSASNALAKLGSIDTDEGALMDTSQLVQQLSNLRVQLEVERRLTEHWREQFFSAQRAQLTTAAPFSKAEANLTPFSRPRGSPLFSAESQAFLANTSAAVSAAIGSFRSGYMILHRQYPFTFDADIGAKCWTQFSTYLPEDFRIHMRIYEEAHLLECLEYAVMYSHGAHGINYPDIADHFGSISLELVQLLMFEKEAATKRSLAGRLAMCFATLADFCKYSIRKSAQTTLMHMCEQIMNRFPNEVNNPELVIQIYSHNALCAPDEQVRQYWITRLLQFSSEHGELVDRRFFMTFSTIDTGLRAGNDSPAQLHEWMRAIEFAQEQINSYGNSIPAENRCDVVTFYRLWFCGLQSEIMRRLGRTEDSLKLLQGGTELYHSIQNNTLKVILFGLAKLCASSDRNGTKPILMMHSFVDAINSANKKNGIRQPALTSERARQTALDLPQSPNTVLQQSQQQKFGIAISAVAATPAAFSVDPVSPRFYEMDSTSSSEHSPVATPSPTSYSPQAYITNEDQVQQGAGDTFMVEEGVIHHYQSPDSSSSVSEVEPMDSSDTFAFNMIYPVTNGLGMSIEFPQVFTPGFPTQLGNSGLAEF